MPNHDWRGESQRLSLSSLAVPRLAARNAALHPSIRGRDGVEKSFVDATDGVLKALSSSSPRKPLMKLALARMYHEILTKVGCIEADAPRYLRPWSDPVCISV